MTTTENRIYIGEKPTKIKTTKQGKLTVARIDLSDQNIDEQVETLVNIVADSGFNPEDSLYRAANAKLLHFIKKSGTDKPQEDDIWAFNHRELVNNTDSGTHPLRIVSEDLDEGLVSVYDESLLEEQLADGDFYRYKLIPGIQNFKEALRLIALIEFKRSHNRGSDVLKNTLRQVNGRARFTRAA